jgi:N-formylglutamate amidohydrolase
MSFRVFPGITDDTPLLVSVPHAGLLVPPDDAPTLAIEGQALSRDADLFVDRLAEGIPALGVTCVVAQVSRYILDVNRAPDDVDHDVCPDFPRPAKASARGLVWYKGTDGEAVLRRPLSLAELESRIARIHTPYHRELTRLLDARRERFGVALLLDLHSMPSMGRQGHGDVGARRADIVPGDARGTSCAPVVMELVSGHFRSRGFSVRENDPYMGGFITRHHGRPSRGIHAIQLELNRDLYMDEEALRYNIQKAARLVPHLHSLVERLRDLRV